MHSYRSIPALTHNHHISSMHTSHHRERINDALTERRSYHNDLCKSMLHLQFKLQISFYLPNTDSNLNLCNAVR